MRCEVTYGSVGLGVADYGLFKLGVISRFSENNVQGVLLVEHMACITA